MGSASRPAIVLSSSSACRAASRCGSTSNVSGLESVPLGTNRTLASLLGPDGFRFEPAICGDSEKIDPIIPPAEQMHVTDADSSQAIVIEEVKRGRNLVIQGPPGTGKSQTITNMIACAVKQGRPC